MASEQKPSGPRSEWPDSWFAVIDTSKSTGKESGRAKPDSVRHLPHHYKNPGGADHSSVSLPLLRNALARMNQISGSPALKAKAKAHLVRHAKVLLPDSQFAKSAFDASIREVMTYIMSGQMNFKQGMEAFDANAQEFENIMVNYITKSKKLPDSAYAIGTLFPHHDVHVKDCHEHGTVNIMLLKYQITRIARANIPIGLKLRVAAHLMCHAKSLLPNSKFVLESRNIENTYANGEMVTQLDNYIFVEGITEVSQGHLHAYFAKVDEYGAVMGQTFIVSDGEEHAHAFSGTIDDSGKLTTAGASAGDDHNHVIDFAKKDISKEMPEMAHESLKDKPKNKDEKLEDKYRIVRIGRLKIALPKRK